MTVTNITAEQIDAVLPQTQCEECGFKGCRPYAEAMAKGEANIDLCPPGGSKTLKQLGELLAIDPQPYLEHAEQQYRAPSVAVIDEQRCIGCVKCIKACPVDAIVGATKLMHTVVSDLCTGCGLCVEPCPMDCIDMLPLDERSEAEQAQKAQQWRMQHQQRQRRLARIAAEKDNQHKQARLNKNPTDKKAAIAAAIARKKAQQAKQP